MTDQELAALRQRIDDIMLGKADVNYDRLAMQREADGGDYDRPAGAQGHLGATLNYRKVVNLDNDPLFLSFMKKPLFGTISQRIYGTERISCFRAMFMNKPAHTGSPLAFHQDHWIDNVDLDPIVTIWTALDNATKENGCVKIFPGTHKSVIPRAPKVGSLTEEQTAELLKQGEPVYLEMAAGESVLLHNWTVHGSDGNTTDNPRRAFSGCYVDSNAKSLINRTFQPLFGPGA